MNHEEVNNPIGSITSLAYHDRGDMVTLHSTTGDGTLKYIVCDGRWVRKDMLPELYKVIGERYNPKKIVTTRYGFLKIRKKTVRYTIVKPNHFRLPNLLPKNNGKPFIPKDSAYHTIFLHYVRVK